MEKLSEAEAMRAEYLELMQIWYGTCITGLRRAKAHMVGTFLGMLVTMSAFYGALIFLEGTVMIAVIVVAVLLTVWWMMNTTKEYAKHKEMMSLYEAIEKKAANIKCEYFALTGTDIAKTLTEMEVEQAYNAMLKKYKL